MGFVILIIAVATVAALWVRSTISSRQRWLQQLNLPGLWELDGEGARIVLELRGKLSNGDYALRREGDTERGEWRLIGNTLTLAPIDGEPKTLELRLFVAGKIGVDGPGHERQIFIKRPDNVVPLRARS